MSKKVFVGNLFNSARRYFVTSSINLGNEVQKAKPFDQIPVLTAFKLLSNSLPGGKYHNASLRELHELFRKDFGEIFKMPAMLGRPSIVFTYNAKDFETVRKFKLFFSKNK